MVSFRPLLVACALATQVFAARTSIICSTELGTKSLKSVPTSTKTSVQNIAVIKKVIRKVNVVVVPVAKTSVIKTTSVVTSTTVAGPATKTETSTITSESVSLIVRKFTTTTTSTTSSTTDIHLTSTVSTVAGFSAILDDLSWVPKRDLEGRNAKRLISVQALTAENYPQRVSCDKKIFSTSIKIVSTVVQSSRITRKASTKIKISTITTTMVSTEYPPGLSTTITTTVYPTITNIVDTIVTETATEIVTVQNQIADTIVYAACSSNNYLLTANGGLGVGNVEEHPAFRRFHLGPGFTKEKCCAACAQRHDCAVNLWHNLIGECQLFIATAPDVCVGGSQLLFGRYFTGTGVLIPRIHWSNGPCGKLTNGGRDDY